MRSPRQQRGYLLITVVVTLFLVATIAVLLNHGSAIGASNATSETEADRINYVAAAGMQHALWRAGNNQCMGNVAIPTTALGVDNYEGTITGAAAGTFYTLFADQDAWIRSDDTDKNNNDTSHHIKFDGGNIEQALYRFDLSTLPAGAQINSATAWFFLKSGKIHPEGPINVHRVTGDWTETGVTWDTLAGSFETSVLGTISAQDQGGVWVQINMTGQVQAWVNGQPNYGVLFNSTAEGIHTEYISREGAANEVPRLDVVVGSGPASPATIDVTGTLANGNTRVMTRTATVLQPASSYTFRPDATDGIDAYIGEANTTTNYGTDDESWVSSASGDTTRSLLKFNVSRVPVGARIVEATLSLERQSGSGADQLISAHRVTNSWNEDSVTWNNRSTGTSWDNSGGDFNRQPIATTPVGPANQHYGWDITALVRDWVDGSIPNFGVILVAAVDGQAGERFYTSDEADPLRRPDLSITYACECGSTCMAPQGSGNILFVIGNSPTSPSAGETAIIEKLESWGYTVSLIQDDDSQGNYNSAIAANDVVLVAESVASSNVGTKLTNSAIGVVTAKPELFDELGIATGNAAPVGTALNIDDTSHYITQVFVPGSLPVKTKGMQLVSTSGTVAPDGQVLASINGAGAIVALDAGSNSSSGGTASGRRALLPIGPSWNYLTNSGQLVIQRTLNWAMYVDSATIGKLLFVVANPDSLGVQDTARKQLMESWGYAVTLIDDSESQGTLESQAANNDVVYVSELVDHSILGDKLRNTPTGVVVEEQYLHEEFGFSEDRSRKSRTQIDVVDNSHYITSEFPTGLLTVFTSAQMNSMIVNVGAGTNVLAELLNTGSNWEPSLATIDVGDELFGGGIAPARRVKLPWENIDVAALNINGRTITRRAIEWAMGVESPSLAPIAHWKLDEVSGTTAVDSVGGQNGTLTNEPEWAAGQLGGGLDFDGVDDAVIVPHSDSLALTQEMTFAAWVNSNEFGESGPYDLVISKGNIATEYDYYFGALDDEIIFGFSAGGSYREFTTSGLNLPTGVWHHIAATFDNSTDTVKLYHAGVEVLSATTTYEPPANSRDLYVGSSEDGADWDGILDDVRIYDRVLSPAEIAELAAPPPLLPIAHWKLDDGVGTNAADSASGHDGTLINGPSWVSGFLGDALSFDGSDDYVDVPHDDSLALTEKMTFTAWVNASNYGSSYQTILSRDPGIVDSNYWFGTWRHELVFGFWSGGFFREIETSGLALQAGAWYHLAATFDNVTNEVQLYVDGTVVRAGTLSQPPGTPTSPVWIGKSIDGEYWAGLLNDVRIYDIVLPDAEISALAAARGDGGGGGGACDGTFRDEFNAESYGNNDGTLTWATDWLEINENDGWDSGDERVDDNDSDFHLRVRDNDGGGEGVQRQADLSNSTLATLSFEYRRDGFDNNRDFVMVHVSPDGGSSWIELERIVGPGTDSSYVRRSHDISDQIAPDTRIRFLTSPNLGSGDELYIDNVEIAVSGCAN